MNRNMHYNLFTVKSNPLSICKASYNLMYGMQSKWSQRQVRLISHLILSHIWQTRRPYFQMCITCLAHNSFWSTPYLFGTCTYVQLILSLISTCQNPFTLWSESYIKWAHALHYMYNHLYRYGWALKEIIKYPFHEASSKVPICNNDI